VLVTEQGDGVTAHLCVKVEVTPPIRPGSAVLRGPLDVTVS